MPKVDFYHRYSDLDNHHEFGIVDTGCGDAYFIWVFFYLGVYFGEKGKSIYMFPFKPYNWEKPVKTYNINGADKVAKLIYNRIQKILNKQ